MSSIPYNYGSYIDAKVAMTDTGHVSAGKQIQSPASAGSRGLAKTTQFTNDRTQMQMGNSPIAESMIEIRSILNRIDGVNAPVQEDAGTMDWSTDKVKEFGNALIQLAKGQVPSDDLEIDDLEDGWAGADQNSRDQMAETIGGQLISVLIGYLQFSAGQKPSAEDVKDAQEVVNDPEFKKAYHSNETAVQEDISDKGRIALEKAGFDPMKVKEYMAVFNDHGDTSEIDQMNMDKVGLADAMAMVLASHDVENESTTEDSGELGRLKELSGIEEDVDMDALKMWNEKYSKYRGMNGDKLPFGLYMQMAQTGVPTDGMEAGEAKQAIADQNPKLDPNDAESLAGSAEEIPGVDFDKADAPITDAMKQELADIMGVDAIGEEEITKAMKILGVSTGMESYQPMPEGDEFDIEEDEDFEEVLGPLGFPEDETELFDAEYQGRKVPLNKSMRGDVKKFKVYVKDPKTGNVKKVNFGHGGTSAKRPTMRIRKSNPKARKSFRARHNCANPGPKTKARYWSCRKW